MDEEQHSLSDTMGDDAGDARFDLTINGYKLVRELSQGGQAVVFLAIQESTGRKVALKLIPGGPLASSRERSLMEKEVRILAALDHPNIVSVIDKGKTADGSSYFVLEYVHGVTLAEFVDDYYSQNGPPETPGDRIALLRLFIRICDAINAAHLRGIVHRDLKPGNIIIDNHGEPHILDFGLARSPLHLRGDDDEEAMSISGQFIGSLQWASPEQAAGAISKVDIRSDVYSLGVMLYEILTGDFPYDVFGDLNEALNNIIHQPPEPPSQTLKARWDAGGGEDGRKRGRCVSPVDETLEGIILKSIAKSRDDRYQSAGELSRALSEYVDGAVAGNQPLSNRSARPWAVAAIMLAVILAGGMLIMWMLPDRPAPGAAARDSRVFGYRVEGDDVVFSFDPRMYSEVRMDSGILTDISSIPRIRTVHVAGPFNGWSASMPAWELHPVRPNLYEIRRPLSDFTGKARWPFKFVINGTAWIGAPEAAGNREVVLEDTATYNLVFQNPAELGDVQTDEIMRYRNRIGRAWKGQDANLIVGTEGDVHFTFNARRSNLGEGIDLTVLEGIPLKTLDVQEALVRDLAPLQDKQQLEQLVISDASYREWTEDIYAALDRQAYDIAALRLDALLARYDGVPAVRTFGAYLRGGIEAMSSLAAAPGVIPESALAREEHHYVVIPQPMSWRQARLYAEMHGAFLASVVSAEEQAWITRTFGQPSLGRTFWLGGTDELYEGHWGWISSEPWTYENWTGIEPNNGDSNEDVLAMKYNGWWNDYNGESEKLPFIMEWKR